MNNALSEIEINEISSLVYLDIAQVGAIETVQLYKKENEIILWLFYL